MDKKREERLRGLFTQVTKELNKPGLTLKVVKSLKRTRQVILQSMNDVAEMR